MSNVLAQRRFPIQFDRVDDSTIVATVKKLIARAETDLATMLGRNEARTFDNTMAALERVGEDLDYAMGIVAHLEATCTSEALREAYGEAQPLVAAFHSKLTLSPRLWQAVNDYAGSPEAQRLSGARARYLQKTIAYLRRHGACLDAAGKERLAQIDVELTKATLRFSQTVLDATNAFELLVDDENSLKGLPDSALAAARQSAAEHNQQGFRFGLHAPSYVPLLTYADNRALREKMYRAVVSRASHGDHDNRKRAEEILALRAEKATLLGYQNFGDLVLEDRMAKQAAKAKEFVAELQRKSLLFFEQEKVDLEAFRKELEGQDAPALEAWDLAYYAELLRKKRYNFDAEELRPYFSFQKVLGGIFDIASRLYGLVFQPWSQANTWHESVQAFKVIDSKNKEWIAGIYIDPFPRSTKQGGAWMDGILAAGRRDDPCRQLGTIVANLTPPIGDKDAQLSHRDVETMFHEFGHLLHHCLSRTELRSQAGTNVAWDFVELPSQIFENWCWERDALDLFARHAETGETIPEALYEAMLKARTFRSASAQMRQLGFAAMDLAIHTEFEPKRDGSLMDYGRKIQQFYSSATLPSEHTMLASFSHLFGSPVGYAAGYYSYKWAEVLDADAFGRFRREGIFSSATGQAFRDAVLSRGDEEEPGKLFENFMGRDPDLNALLQRLGLQADQSEAKPTTL